MEDRRAHRRESLAPFVELFPEDGGAPVTGYPVDMSRGGLALESDRTLPVDSRVSVGVHFDPVVDEGEEGGESPVEFVSAHVVRVARIGGRHKISVVFDSLSESDHPLLWGGCSASSSASGAPRPRGHRPASAPQAPQSPSIRPRKSHGPCLPGGKAGGRVGSQ